MERQAIKSSNIKSVGHDGANLQVEFKNGKVWQYEGVSPAQYQKLLEADSPGSYFARNIRNSHDGKLVQ